MSIYTQFDEDGPCLQCASNVGWSEFGDWVETLKAYSRLAALFDTGACEDIPGLRAELETALKKDKPESPDVESVLQQLLHNIDAAGDAEIVLMTAGVTTGKNGDGTDSAATIQQKK
jgi:hypothetical protein